MFIKRLLRFFSFTLIGLLVFISLAVFTPNRSIEGTVTAFVDTASAAPPDRATVLTSGVPGRFA